MTDEELMNAYKRDSEEAFNLLYQRYSDRIYAYLARRIKSNHLDDMFQLVWHHLHEKRHLYSGQSFAPWFYVLARNLLIDEYRSLGRKRKFEEAYKPELELKNNETILDLDKLLSGLSEDTAALIQKYYFQGDSYEELSIQYNVSEVSLRKKFSRAFQLLRNQMGGES